MRATPYAIGLACTLAYIAALTVGCLVFVASAAAQPLPNLPFASVRTNFTGAQFYTEIVLTGEPWLEGEMPKPYVIVDVYGPATPNPTELSPHESNPPANMRTVTAYYVASGVLRHRLNGTMRLDPIVPAQALAGDLSICDDFGRCGSRKFRAIWGHRIDRFE